MAVIANIALVAAALTSVGTTIAQAVEKVPKPPGVPGPQDREVSAAQKRARELAAGRGRRSTVLTSGRGLADETMLASRPRLLGDTA